MPSHVLLSRPTSQTPRAVSKKLFIAQEKLGHELGSLTSLWLGLSVRYAFTWARVIFRGFWLNYFTIVHVYRGWELSFTSQLLNLQSCNWLLLCRMLLTYRNYDMSKSKVSVFVQWYFFLLITLYVIIYKYCDFFWFSPKTPPPPPKKKILY